MFRFFLSSVRMEVEHVNREIRRIMSERIGTTRNMKFNNLIFGWLVHSFYWKIIRWIFIWTTCVRAHKLSESCPNGPEEKGTWLHFLAYRNWLRQQKNWSHCAMLKQGHFLSSNICFVLEAEQMSHEYTIIAFWSNFMCNVRAPIDNIVSLVQLCAVYSPV